MNDQMLPKARHIYKFGNGNVGVCDDSEQIPDMQGKLSQLSDTEFMKEIENYRKEGRIEDNCEFHLQ